MVKASPLETLGVTQRCLAVVQHQTQKPQGLPFGIAFLKRTIERGLSFQKIAGDSVVFSFQRSPFSQPGINFGALLISLSHFFTQP